MRRDEDIEAIRRSFHHLPCGVVVASTSAAGEVLVVNEEFTAITGYTLDDVPTVGDWLRRAYPDPEYRAVVMGNWERDVSQPGRDVYYRVRCADGSDKELLLRAGLLDEDSMVVALLDLSETRRVQRELRRSEERFRLIAATVQEVFWIHGVGPERMEYVSPAFEAVWGRPVDVLYDDPHEWSATILEEDRPEVDAAWRLALAGGADRVRFEYRIRRPDGEIRHIEDSGNAVRDPDGAVVRIVGIAKDVTARRQAEEARRELQQRMQFAHKMESLGVLAGGVAHDFNNLLMGILGNADLAMQRLPADSPAREGLEDIGKAARRAADLARQMLAYAGRGHVTPSRVDLRRLVEEFGHLLESMVPTKGALRFDLGEQVPAIEADATQIRQVVMNLVTNASDALGEGGGVIRVSVGARALSARELARLAPGEERSEGVYGFVQVTDTGSGMDAETRSRMFDPFYSTKFTGRGLGMAVVHGIVHTHRGVIEVDSAPGEGTSVRVLFPAVEGEAEATPEGHAPVDPAPGRRHGTILLVDDEPTVLEVVSRMLHSCGYDVLTAADGREAERLYREHGEGIAGVILDWTMPEPDGRATLRALRAIDPAARVLVSSGFGESEATERFDEDRPDGFLQKPYTVSVMCDALRRVLEDPPR